MTFEDWIDEKGLMQLAIELDVSYMTVHAWRNGNGNPKVDTMRKIKQMTKGKVTYDMIIDRPVMNSNVPRFRKK